MTFDVILLSRAEIELEDAFLWYESKSKELGIKFMNSFRSEVKRIGSNPFQFMRSQDHFREVAVNFFPYVLIYSVFNDKVYIHSIFNTSRNPNKKP
ncbi:hypothetical protein GCM10007103_28360 [Salinimicrobium marinum]|uniref:Type II toxin-antitoxin system RelE/ParE family toxin n=1 Tax=Salinimicrobium marinum TaxID=680283 RepID=A0A918W0K7_9FLAO|nr:hypothetical protein [Salinimicrobium marinum]GHA45615.1 hypothetical protein GCM10007103_28360 [Salinimicrobium marinum]